MTYIRDEYMDWKVIISDNEPKDTFIIKNIDRG